MEQGSLFHEDVYDALRTAIKALGGTKKVAASLWPEKTAADARSYLDDCLNKDRPAKLSPEHVLLLLKWAKERGCHDAINYICAEAGYAIPAPIEPEDELTKLIREYLRHEQARDTLKPKIDERLSKLRVA
jgi:hypothetical protein